MRRKGRHVPKCVFVYSQRGRVKSFNLIAYIINERPLNDSFRVITVIV